MAWFQFITHICSVKLEYTMHSNTILYIIGMFFISVHQINSALQQRHKYRILKLHNMYRRLFANGAYNVDVADMSKLDWSLELQQEAKSKLNCAKIHELHKTEDIRVNLGLSRRRKYSHIVHSWFKEIQHFLPSFKTCLNIKECSHFFSLINAEHRRIGCETTTCSANGTRLHVFMCLYDGGDIFEPLYKSGTPCTKCADENSFCDRGLCVPCTESSGTCDCRKTCNGAGQLNTTSCSCTCDYGMGPNCDEPCRNPEQYLDYDICDTVSPGDCLTDDLMEKEMLHEFCPEQCVCRKASMPDYSN